jgi:hypothetical protein
MPIRILRLFLLFSAFGWAVGIVGVFVSWPKNDYVAHRLGSGIAVF